MQAWHTGMSFESSFFCVAGDKFSNVANAVFEDMAMNVVLTCRVVGQRNGIPCLELYLMQGQLVKKQYCGQFLHLTLLRLSTTCGLLKFKAQATNAFFATVNQMFGGSPQLPTTAERAVMKSLCTLQTTKQCSAVVVSSEDPPNI